MKGYSPLHIAVKSGTVDIVRMLLINGQAKTNVKGHRHKTPLHYAKSPEMVKLLMQHLTEESDTYCKQLNVEVVTDCTSAQNYVQADELKHLEQCKCNEFAENGTDTLFSFLLRHNDSAAVSLLDEHITLTGPSIESRDALIVYDFSIFQQEANDPIASADPDRKDITYDFPAHMKMIKSKSKAFEHPLSTVFVDLESQCFNIYLPWIILRAMLLVFSLSGLILCEKHLLPQTNNETQKLFWDQINMGLNNVYDLEQGSNWNYMKLGFYSFFGFVCFSTLLIIYLSLIHI